MKQLPAPESSAAAGATPGREKKRLVEMWSIRWRPRPPERSTSPPSPSPLRECSRIRRVSIVEAQSTTNGARSSSRLRSGATTTTPSARSRLGSSCRWLTTVLLRSSTLPVARARARVLPGELDGDQGASGRGRCSRKPREWIRGSPSSRPMAWRRCSSPGVKGRGGR